MALSGIESPLTTGKDHHPVGILVSDLPSCQINCVTTSTNCSRVARHAQSLVTKDIFSRSTSAWRRIRTHTPYTVYEQLSEQQITVRSKLRLGRLKQRGRLLIS